MRAVSGETAHARRAALRVIECDGVGNCPRTPRPDDGLPIILPPIDMHSIMTSRQGVHAAMGMKRGQVALVDRLASCDVDALKSMVDAYGRIFTAERELKAAIEAQRRLMLAILLKHRPTAARRIMKGLRLNVRP
jgi:hypothetical protein